MTHTPKRPARRRAVGTMADVATAVGITKKQLWEIAGRHESFPNAIAFAQDRLHVARRESKHLRIEIAVLTQAKRIWDFHLRELRAELRAKRTAAQAA